MPSKILLILLYCFVWSEVCSQQIVKLDNKKQKIELQNHLFTIYEDTSCQLNFNDIRQKVFYKHSSNTLNFSYSPSKFWIKIHLQNNSDKKWILGILATLVDEFELYELTEDGRVAKRVSGDKFPHKERTYDLPVFAFDINLPRHQSSTIFLSVKSIDTKQFTLVVEEEDFFLKAQHHNIYLWFFYFGLLFMMVVYNLLLYFSIYDKAYLFYVFYILSFIFAQLTVLGFGNQFIWGNHVWFNNRTPAFFSASTGIFALLFAYYFLNVKRFFSQGKIIFAILIGFNVILGTWSVIKPSIWCNQTSPYLIVFQVIIVVFIGMYIMRKGYPPARYYMLSWGILFLALILFALKMMGYLPYNTINYTLLPIGAVIEVLMLSLGLGNRINTAQKEKTLAQQALVKQLQENEQVRTRIARDLHDDLGSTLSSIRILSEFAQNQTQSNPDKVPNLLERITNSTQKLQENLQDIVWTTQSKGNTIENLLVRMRLFGGEVLEAKNINFQFEIEPNIHKVLLMPDVQYDIFMIFKEAINNLVKYAEAKNVVVSFKLKDEMTLTIKDDGTGFDTEQEREGNGLKNMPRRAENIGGQLTIYSKNGAGTEIQLTLPVPK